MANVGDVNRDGFADLAIGDPTAGDSNNGDVVTGRVYVFSGSDLSVLWVLTSPAEYRQFGVAVAGLGDLDDDGHADILVGAEGEAGVQGHVRVYSGRTGEVLGDVAGGLRSGRFGSSVAGLGDVNDDEYEDFVVGARLTFGAFVYSGKDFSLLYELTEQEPGEAFGAAVAGIGDLNGDNHPDLLVSAPENNYLGVNSGRVYAFNGPDGALIGAANGDRSESHFGSSLANIGDINHDQIDDFVVGAPSWLSEQGRVTVVSGATLLPLLNLDGEPGSRFGWSVANAGDADGDLLADIVVGAPRGRDPQNRPHGRVYLFGSDGTPLRSECVVGEESDLGSAVAGGFLFDGDDTADFAGSAPSGGFGAVCFTYLSDCSLRLYVVATCPGGGPIEVRWEHATPDALIALLYATNRGSYRVPFGQPCQGTVLGLGPSQLQVVYRGHAGEFGSRALSGIAGPNACGGWLQLLDTESCATSEVVLIE